jgi:hypothetical protein
MSSQGNKNSVSRGEDEVIDHELFRRYPDFTTD